MSKIVKHAYVNSPHTRVLSAADFKALGVEQGKTEWGPGNRHTAEISDEAAAKLLEVEPGEWKIVDDSSTGDGDAFEPLGSDEDDDETASTSTAKRTSGRRTANS